MLPNKYPMVDLRTSSAGLHLRERRQTENARPRKRPKLASSTQNSSPTNGSASAPAIQPSARRTRIIQQPSATPPMLNSASSSVGRPAATSRITRGAKRKQAHEETSRTLVSASTLSKQSQTGQHTRQNNAGKSKVNASGLKKRKVVPLDVIDMADSDDDPPQRISARLKGKTAAGTNNPLKRKLSDDVIDLCSDSEDERPARRPVQTREVDGTILILSSDDEDSSSSPPPSRSKAATTPNATRKSATPQAVNYTPNVSTSRASRTCLSAPSFTFDPPVAFSPAIKDEDSTGLVDEHDISQGCNGLSNGKISLNTAEDGMVEDTPTTKQSSAVAEELSHTVFSPLVVENDFDQLAQQLSPVPNLPQDDTGPVYSPTPESSPTPRQQPENREEDKISPMDDTISTDPRQSASHDGRDTCRSFEPEAIEEDSRESSLVEDQLVVEALISSSAYDESPTPLQDDPVSSESVERDPDNMLDSIMEVGASVLGELEHDIDEETSVEMQEMPTEESLPSAERNSPSPAPNSVELEHALTPMNLTVTAVFPTSEPTAHIKATPSSSPPPRKVLSRPKIITSPFFQSNATANSSKLPQRVSPTSSVKDTPPTSPNVESEEKDSTVSLQALYNAALAKCSHEPSTSPDVRIHSPLSCVSTVAKRKYTITYSDSPVIPPLNTPHIFARSMSARTMTPVERAKSSTTSQKRTQKVETTAMKALKQTLNAMERGDVKMSTWTPSWNSYDVPADASNSVMHALRDVLDGWNDNVSNKALNTMPNPRTSESRDTEVDDLTKPNSHSLPLPNILADTQAKNGAGIQATVLKASPSPDTAVTSTQMDQQDMVMEVDTTVEVPQAPKATGLDGLSKSTPTGNPSLTNESDDDIDQPDRPVSERAYAESRILMSILNGLKASKKQDVDKVAPATKSPETTSFFSSRNTTEIHAAVTKDVAIEGPREHMQPADSEMLGLPSSSNQDTNPELSVPLDDIDLETGGCPGIQKEENQSNSFVGSENATIPFDSSFSKHTSVQLTNLQDASDTHSRLQYVEADCPGLQADMRMTDTGEIEQLTTEARSPSLDPQDILRQSLEVGSPTVDRPVELEFTPTQITQAEHHVPQSSFDEPMTHEPSPNMSNDTSIITATEAWIRTSPNSNSSLDMTNTLDNSSVPITSSTDSQLESSADVDSFPDFAAFEIDFLTTNKLDDSDDDDSSQVDDLNFQYPDDITAYT